MITGINAEIKIENEYMKIAMIGQKGVPALYGGVERHVEELSKELAKAGHEILVYARKWYTKQLPAVEHPENISVIHTPSIHTKHLDAITHTFISTLHAILKRVDVIHYHGVGPALLGFLPRLLSPKTKVVATFHSIDRYHKKWGWFARFMLKLGERAACAFPHETISVCKTIHSYCLNEYYKATAFIPNGVHLPAAANPQSLATFGLEPNKYILMVSRLISHKGAHYLIEAWKFVKRQYPKLFRELKLVIAGDSVFTDSYVTFLRKLAEGEDSIVFTGWRHGAELNALYAHTALFVHPSENEGLPLTVLQAMAAGRPVLVSDIPEHQEIVTDSRFWFANASASSLAHKLIDVMQDTEKLASAGEYNKQLVTERYQWTHIAEQTGTLYAKLLRDPKAGIPEFEAV